MNKSPKNKTVEGTKLDADNFSYIIRLNIHIRRSKLFVYWNPRNAQKQFRKLGPCELVAFVREVIQSLNLIGVTRPKDLISHNNVENSK